MSAHRRSGLREEATPGRRYRAVRLRRRIRPYQALSVLLGATLVGIAAAAGPGLVSNGWQAGQRPGDGKPFLMSAVPQDLPDRGLVYRGLRLGDEDAVCAGAFELADPETCTYGPDMLPAGLAVDADVAPVTVPAPEPSAPVRETTAVPSDPDVVRDDGGIALAAAAPALIPDAAPGEAAFVLGDNGVACEGDGRTGKRVQVLYLHEFGTPSRYPEYLGSIRTWSAQIDAIVDASAAETGGSRHVRFVTTPQCGTDVAEVQVPAGSLNSFPASIAALQQLGYNRADRKYLVFADSNVYCGIATFVADQRKGLGNRNNGGPSYGRVDAGCWGAQIATHELVHTLGALMHDAPNTGGAGHCTDGYDVMCAPDVTQADIRTVCPKDHALRLDCNHDDYFHTDPEPGTHLADSWNVAQSDFLLRGDGDEELPPGVAAPPPPAAASTPAGAPGESPGGSAAATGGSPSAAAGQPDGATGSTAPDHAPAGVPATGGGSPDGGVGAEASRNASPGSGDAVPAPSGAAQAPGPGPKASTDGEVRSTPQVQPAAAPVQAVLEIRDETSTSARLTWSAAAPNATYEVLVNDTVIATATATRARLIGMRPATAYTVAVRATAQQYLAKAAVRTAPAARPAQDSWFFMSSSLTGGAADLYAARTANGTPIVLNGPEGGSQQQWKLTPTEDGSYALQSRATGKCVAPQGGNPVAGSPLVQEDCASDGSRRWSVRYTDHGFSLVSSVGGLVVGVGGQRFGTHRLLVLQQPNQSRHQSWTALPS